jgi:hypothetical protein
VHKPHLKHNAKGCDFLVRLVYFRRCKHLSPRLQEGVFDHTTSANLMFLLVSKFR